MAPVRGIGFDADADECARLNALGSGMRYLPFALGAEDGANGTLYVTRSPGSSSLYEPNQDFVAPFPFAASMTVERTIPVQLATLDTVCRRESIAPDVLKLDIQGGELDVLRGASSLLPGTFLIESEVEFNPQYRSQPLFTDMDRFLRERGWLLLGLRRAYWRRHAAHVADGGTLVHGDALWFNPGVLAAADNATLLKAIAALAAYRQMDFVTSLLGRVQMPAVPPALLARRPLFARAAGAVMRRLAPHRRWRGWLDDLCPADVEDWHDPDEFF